MIEQKEERSNQKIFLKPYWIVLLLAIVIFISEIIVMVLISLMPPLPVLQEALVDSLMLVALLSPALFFFLFKPIILEIKERKRLEDDVRKKEERNRLILESIPEMFFILNTDGVFTGFKAMKGMEPLMPPEDFIGKNASEVLPTKVAEQTLKHIELVFRTEKPQLFEYELNLKGNLHKYEAKIARISVDEVLCIVRDITERKQTEDGLRSSLSLLNATLESTADGILVVDRNGHITRWNQKFADMWQISEEILSTHSDDQALNHVLHNLVQPDAFLAKVRELYGKPEASSVDLIDLTGGRIFERYSQPQRIGNDIIGRVWSFRDITERKQAEEKIKKSLVEKEVLLREIHHRVKNNMQIISSLLGLTSGTIHEQKYIEMFRDSQDRINSMSLIHEKLYCSRDFVKIDFNEYLRELANSLFKSHGITDLIELKIYIENVSLGIDHAIPCGLIINELFTNSLKYAFPGARRGEIKISLQLNDENMNELIVGDNGVGIPEDVDFRKTESLGLRLVTILVENQLNGKIDLDRSDGTEFKIKFREG